MNIYRSHYHPLRAAHYGKGNGNPAIDTYQPLRLERCHLPNNYQARQTDGEQNNDRYSKELPSTSYPPNHHWLRHRDPHFEDLLQDPFLDTGSAPSRKQAGGRLDPLTQNRLQAHLGANSIRSIFLNQKNCEQFAQNKNLTGSTSQLSDIALPSNNSKPINCNQISNEIYLAMLRDERDELKIDANKLFRNKKAHDHQYVLLQGQIKLVDQEREERHRPIPNSKFGPSQCNQTQEIKKVHIVSPAK